ncbi:MAG: type II toxin-antitoxin system VapC family toxin [bacterium]
MFSCQASSVFLDTDVILDLFIKREPHHSVALRFFSYLQVHADSIQAYTSPVVIANVGYILGKAQSEPYAVIKIKGLRDFVRVLPMAEPEVDRAIANTVKIIVTRNGDDFLTDGVQALEPEEFMKMDFAEKST